MSKLLLLFKTIILKYNFIFILLFFFKFIFFNLLHKNFFFLIPIFILIFLIFFLFLVPYNFVNFIKIISLNFTCLIFIFYCVIFTFTLNLNNNFLYFYTINFDNFNNFSLTFGLDNINFFFILLTTFLFPICILISWNNIFYNLKFYLILFLILELFLLLTFLSFNIFFFFFFFECTMVPMFLLIGIWGSRQRKIHATFYFFFYTLFGSFFLLTGIILLYSHAKTLDWQILNNLTFSKNIQLILWIFFFLGFCIKIPMVPFHIWLPEAHVEAPTSGSVLLAGILLKIGSYGIFRFIICLFPYASKYFSNIVFTLSIISIIYISAIAIRQIDLKKIIAYSSIAHMNFVILGLFSNSLEGIAGSIFLMLSHGIVSSALFICISIIYDRYHTRLISYYGNLVSVMPLYSVFFFFFILANISFPGTSNFIGELLILLGLVDNNFFIIFLAVFSIILTAIYSIWFINKILFGSLKIKNFFFSDLNKREFYILLLLLLLTLLFGFKPNLILNKIEFLISLELIKTF